MPHTSQIHCPRCQQKVKINGFLNHVQLSTNSLCHQESGVDAAGKHDTDSESVTSRGSEPNPPSEDDENEPDPFLLQGLYSPAHFGPDAAYTSDYSDWDETGVHPSLGIDPTGDLYRDYDLLQYEMDVDDPPKPDEAIGWLEGDVMATWESEDDEEEVEVEEVHQAQLEYGLEPERPIQMHIDHEEGGDSDGMEDAAVLVTPADCDGAEVNLCQWPFIVQFPGLAGTPQARTKPAHAHYGEMMNKNQDSPNIYTPFSSRLEWDIAHWAKVRSPSSTSFMEVISIPGVCSLGACVAQTHHLTWTIGGWGTRPVVQKHKWAQC